MRPPTFARDLLVSSSSYTDLTEWILWICQLDTDILAQYTKKSVVRINDYSQCTNSCASAGRPAGTSKGPFRRTRINF